MLRGVSTPTPTQALASVKLGEDVLDWIADKRNTRPQWSWRLIAEELAARTGVTVTGEAIRQWMVARDPDQVPA